MPRISFVNLIRKNETAEYPRVEASKEALANARVFLSQANENVENAEEEVEAIVASWTRLNEIHTANDYAVAAADIERTKAFANGAERQVKTAERNILSSDTALACAVADVIRLSLPADTDTNVVATFLKDLTDVPTEQTLILVTQTEAATRSRHGSLSGNLAVRYFRTAGHRPLDLDAISRANNGDMRARFGNLRTNAADTIDTVEIVVESIAPAIPLIANVSPSDAKIVGDKLATSIAVATLYHNEGVKAGVSKVIVNRTQHVNVASDQSFLVSVNADGPNRLVTIETSVVWLQHQGLSGSRTVAGIAKEKAQALTGQFIPGLGRVESVSIVTGESALLDSRAILKVVRTDSDRPVDSALSGYENVGQIVVRAIIASATA